MMMQLVKLTPLLALPLLGEAAPSEDLVSSLPGWDGPLPSRWWSGFLNVGQTEKKIHNTFNEKKDEPDAASKPVGYVHLLGGECRSLARSCADTCGLCACT